MKLKKGNTPNDLWFNDQIKLFEKEMRLDENDIALIDKWNLSLTEILENDQETEKQNDFEKILPQLRNNFENFQKFEKDLIQQIKTIFEKIRKRQNFVFPASAKFIETLKENSVQSGNFLFFLNTKKQTNRVEDVTFLTCCYAVLNALKLKIETKWIDAIFNTSLIIDSYFTLHSPHQIKEKISQETTDLKDLSFLKDHCIEGYKTLANNSKLSKFYLNAVLVHHEYQNKNGFFKLPPTKIAPLVNFITVAHEYVYYTSQFLSDFFSHLSPAEAIALMLERGKCYHPKVIENFAFMLSVHPSGEIVEFKDSKTPLGYAISVGGGSSFKDVFYAPIIDSENKMLWDHPVTSIQKNTSSLKILRVVKDIEKRKKILDLCYRQWFNQKSWF